MFNGAYKEANEFYNGVFNASYSLVFVFGMVLYSL